MSRRRFFACAAVAAALLGWQVIALDTVKGGSGGIPVCGLMSASAEPGCYMACPWGDGDRLDEVGSTISVTVRDLEGDGIPGIPASDFWLIGCAEGLVLCGGGGAINADSATNADGETTMSGALYGSGCEIGGVAVVVQGGVVDLPSCEWVCLPITTVSPDVTGDGGEIDGVVELADFAAYGLVHNKPGDYDACFDYNCDGRVDLIDLSVFGQHWLHAC